MTKTCIHFDLHNHPISCGDCCESIEFTKELVRCEVDKNLDPTISAIVLVADKTFMNHELFVSSETSPVKLQGANLHGLMDIFSILSSPNIKSLVSTFWHGNF